MAKVPSQFEALNQAIDTLGSQAAMARLLGVSQTAVWKWVQQARKIPAEYVLRVEAETGISRHWLRPDIYPVESSPPPVFIGVDRRMAPVAAAARTVPSRDAKAA